jgi:hypothetical protein
MLPRALRVLLDRALLPGTLFSRPAIFYLGRSNRKASREMVVGDNRSPWNNSLSVFSQRTGLLS